MVFMGTPDFAVPSLEFLAGTETVLAVVTKPDRPRGRGRHLKPQPVKLAAEGAGLPVYEPDSVHQQLIKKLSDLLPDVLITVAYGELLPEAVLRLPPRGCVNVHPSLLPSYRGPCPIEWSLINGEKSTGVTSIYMNRSMDGGDIIVQKTLPIEADFTAGDLSKRLSVLAVEVLGETLDKLKSGEAAGCPQDEEKASLAPFLRKVDCLIDWKKDAFCLRNLVRGINPHPGAYTRWGINKVLKVWEADALERFSASGVPGEVVGRNDDVVIVACGRGFIALKKVQVPGGRPITGSEFERGYHIVPGFRFGQ